MRYWSFSNLPLFLLAAPMLWIMVQSALWGWARILGPYTPEPVKAEFRGDISGSVHPGLHRDFARGILRRFALPQFILAVLALTSYHVQIITRLASGYPVWYWWLALLMVDQHETNLFGRRWNTSKIWVRWIVFYATIQGGLFASFLPPA